MREVFQTASANLSGSSGAKNYADGSFEQLLFIAQQNLEQLFKAYSFEADFDSSKQKDNNLKTENKEENGHSFDNPNPKEEKSIKTAEYELGTTEILKELLAKNIPLPAPSFLAVYAGNITPEQILSKTDLEIIINEIVKNARLVKSGQKTELSLTLSYKDLGELFVSFIMKNGQVAINIAAEAETKKLIEENLEELELALKESKIELDSIKISEIKQGGR